MSIEREVAGSNPAARSTTTEDQRDVDYARISFSGPVVRREAYSIVNLSQGLAKQSINHMSTMTPQVYIGCKVIKAYPMGEEEFKRTIKKEEAYDGENPPGYCVHYPNDDGSVYKSWSPKDVFENAYRPLTPGEATFVQHQE